MKNQTHTCLTGIMALATGATLCAQEKAQPSAAAAPPTKPASSASAGLLNDWLRGQSENFSRWDVGGQFRARFESKNNMAVAGTAGAIDFAEASPEPHNNYLLLRTKVHLGYTPVDWVSLYGEGRNSASSGDKRNPNPESDGAVDLHQSYLTLGNGKDCPFTAKVGRQELSYGDERMIGAVDWNNIGRVFDAGKLRFQNDALWVDGFVSRVVVPDDNNFNVVNDYDWFSGIYASTRTLIPKQETQLYFLADNVSADSTAPGSPAAHSSPRDVYTLGARVKSLPGQLKGWDYDAELAGQYGNFQMSTTAALGRLEHRAWAAHVAGGYTLEKTWATPRLGLEYNFASGDSDPTDDQHETFENLFPTNHKFYGYMDFFSWQNTHNVRANASIKPVKGLMITADYHAFWLADTSDYFYQANGRPRTSGYGINASAGSFVGHEVDLIATYTYKTYGSVQAGYGHFFVGEYVNDTLASLGGATGADWAYVQLLFNF